MKTLFYIRTNGPGIRMYKSFAAAGAASGMIGERFLGVLYMENGDLEYRDLFYYNNETNVRIKSPTYDSVIKYAKDVV